MSRLELCGRASVWKAECSAGRITRAAGEFPRPYGKAVTALVGPAHIANPLASQVMERAAPSGRQAAGREWWDRHTAWLGRYAGIRQGDRFGGVTTPFETVSHIANCLRSTHHIRAQDAASCDTKVPNVRVSLLSRAALNHPSSTPCPDFS
jgi:hypothetical protein